MRRPRRWCRSPRPLGRPAPDRRCRRSTARPRRPSLTTTSVRDVGEGAGGARSGSELAAENRRPRPRSAPGGRPAPAHSEELGGADGGERRRRRGIERGGHPALARERQRRRRRPRASPRAAACSRRGAGACPRAGRSSTSASLAPASGTIVRSPPGSTSTRQVPVGRSGSSATRASTPAASSSATASRPNASSPARRDERHGHAAARPATPPRWRPGRRRGARSAPACRSRAPAGRSAARRRRP